MTKSNVKSAERPWGWVIVFASFMVHFFAYGTAWSAGIFNVVFLEAFGAPKSVTSWAGALVVAVMFAVGPFSSMLVNKFGCRKVTIVGGVLHALGLIISSFAPNIYIIYCSFGILTGLGCGVAFIPSIVSVTYYFDRRRSFALGLTVSGLGLGTFVFPPFIRWLVDLFGWRGGFVILGAMSLNVCVCGALMRPIRVQQSRERNCSKLMDCRIFRKLSYVFLCINNFLVCFGLSVVYVHLAAYCESTGIDAERSSLIMSAIGITNLVGRVMFGLINQHPKMNPNLGYAISFALSGMAIILIPVLVGYVHLLVLSSLFGFLSGCFGTLLVPITALVVGIPRFSNAYGLLMVFEGVGSLTGAPFAGLLYDIMQSYDMSLYIGGACIIVSSLTMTVPFYRTRTSNKSVNMEVETILPEEKKLTAEATNLV